MNRAPNAVWQKNPALAWREIDEETVIITPNESVMHELNDTGSFIWRQVDGQKSASDIAGLLAASYEVSPEAALVDTEALLEELSERKLLLPRDEAAGGAVR